jgi:DNA gyrase subunit A
MDLNIIGRATQGVRLINLGKRNDEIASVCKVMSEAETEESIIENPEDPDNGENIENNE